MMRTEVQGSPDHVQDQREQRRMRHQNHQAATTMRTEVQGSPDHGQARRGQRKKRSCGQGPSMATVIVREKAQFASQNSLGSKGMGTVPKRRLNWIRLLLESPFNLNHISVDVDVSLNSETFDCSIVLVTMMLFSRVKRVL